MINGLKEERKNGWMDYGWIDEWIDGRKEGWMDGWMDGWIWEGGLMDA